MTKNDLLLLVFFICTYVNGKAVQKIEKMDTIFCQTENNITLSLVREYKEATCNWKTILLNNKNGKKLIIDSDSLSLIHSPYVGSIKRNSFVGFYNIIFSVFNDKDIYIFYDKFGKIICVHYHFTAAYSFEKKETLLSQYLCHPNWGKQNNDFRYVRLNNKLYFYLSTGQLSTDKHKSFYTLDFVTSQLKKNVFNESNNRMVVGIYAKHKNLYDHIDEESLSRERLDQINEFKKYLDKLYYLYEVSNNEDLRKKEIDKFRNINLHVYPVFEKSKEITKKELLQINSTKYRNLSKKEERLRAEQILSEVLETIGHKLKSTIKIQDYFFLGNSDYMEMYYFFYTNEHNRMQITRYDMYENLWYISDFEETDFEPQIDIYKSPDSKL